MVATGPAEAFSVFVMFLFGGFGLPFGVPPAPEDELLARVAPPECLYYTTWSGMAPADPASQNQTEQLLAEPEIQQLVTLVSQQLTAALQQAAAQQGDPQVQQRIAEVPKLVKLLITRPTAVFVSSLAIGPSGPQIQGGAMVNVGEEIAATKAALEKLQTELLGDQVREVTVAGAKFYQLQLRPGAPPVIWGARGKYLFLGLGEGALEGIFERARGTPPKWLTDLRKRLPVERMSTVTYVNVAQGLKLVTTVAGAAGTPEVGKVVEALGVSQVTEFEAISGLDATGFVTHTWLGLAGEPKGLFAACAGKPLTAKDLAPLPAEALVAAAFRLDLGKVLEQILHAAGEIEPRAAAELERELSQMETGLGFSLREDLFKALGDVWTISTTAQEGGLLTGWLATVQIRDREQLKTVHKTLLNQFRQMAGDRPDSPQIRTWSSGNREVYYLYVQDEHFPLTPAWCLTEDQLVVGLFPQAVKSYVARGEGFRSLAENPAVKPHLDGALAVTYADTQQLIRQLYPLAQIGLHFALHEVQRQGVNLDPMILPSLSALDRHLLPSVATLRRTQDGLLATTRGSLFGGSIGTAVPMTIGLALPAVQSVRGAARRTQSADNLRNIAIALHNFHDTYRHFPAAYSADKDGKPLLSWRVFMLPFLDQAQLYEQFHLDEPWDSEHNKTLIAKMPAVFRAPGSKAAAEKTVYLGVRGKDMVFVEPKEGSTPRSPKGTGIAEITDGTSNTLMVVEASDAAAVTWTKPDDFEPKENNPIQGLVGVRTGGFQAVFCDGSVRFLAETIDVKLLWNLFRRNDGNPISDF